MPNDPPSADDSLLRPGDDVWCVERADRVTVIDEPAAYFEAVAEMIPRARHSIFILAWDIHSKLVLDRRERTASAGMQLRELLVEAATARPELQIFILLWSYSRLYQPERELFPRRRFGTSTPDNVHFLFDKSCPPGGSSHEKIVVVDDELAFVGGIDLSVGRWESRERLARDPRRRNPAGELYGPRSDVHTAMSGPIVRCVAQHVRAAWRRACRCDPPSPDARRDAVVETVRSPGGAPLWPKTLEAELTGVEVALTRTVSECLRDGEPTIKENEDLTLAALAAAQQCIYIENQYVSAGSVAQALCKRLKEPDGPEVVIITPKATDGFLEEATVGVLRSRVAAQLAEADVFDRLRFVYPRVLDEETGESLPVYVHAKIMVIDDRLVKVGSANLSNRSLCLDTELDVAIEARDEAMRDRIAAIRRRLLCGHLGCTPRELDAALDAHGTLRAVIDACREDERTLVQFLPSCPAWLERQVPASALFDPERPLDIDHVADEMLPTNSRPEASRAWLRGAIVLALIATVVGGLIAFSRTTEITPERVVAFMEPIRDRWWAPLAAVGGLAVGGTIGVPLVALLLACGMFFGAGVGYGVALIGTLLACLSTWSVGRALGRRGIERVGWQRLDSMCEWMQQRGVLSVTVLRLVPVAPFAVTNAVIGASGVKLRDYMVGNLIGLVPGILVPVVFGDQLWEMLLEPNMTTAIVLTALVLGALVLGALVRRYVGSGGAAGRTRDEPA